MRVRPEDYEVIKDLQKDLGLYTMGEVVAMLLDAAIGDPDNPDDEAAFQEYDEDEYDPY